MLKQSVNPDLKGLIGSQPGSKRVDNVKVINGIDGLAQECDISSAAALEIPQACVNSLRPSDAYMRR